MAAAFTGKQVSTQRESAAIPGSSPLNLQNRGNRFNGLCAEQHRRICSPEEEGYRGEIQQTANTQFIMDHCVVLT